MRKFTKHRNSWKCIQWIFVQSRIIKSGLLFLNFKTISRKFIKMKKNKVSRISILTFLIIKNYPSSGQKIRQNERSYVYVNWMSTTFHEFFAKVYEKNCTDKKIRIKNRENRGKNVNLNLCIFEFKFRLELTRKIKNWKKKSSKCYGRIPHPIQLRYLESFLEVFLLAGNPTKAMILGEQVLEEDLSPALYCNYWRFTIAYRICWKTSFIF